MGKEIPLETRFTAEELYIVDGLTYDLVAERTGVSVSQLQRWGTEGNWLERKREYRQAFADIRRNTITLRQKLIKKAVASLDPQDVYAVARLEKAAAASKQNTGHPDGDCLSSGDPVRIKSPADAVDALNEVIERKLAAMLTRPDQVNLANVKNIKQAVELIEKMKTRYQPEDNSSKGLDAETLAEIADKIKLL
jgi:hypothetical protein